MSEHWQKRGSYSSLQVEYTNWKYQTNMSGCYFFTNYSFKLIPFFYIRFIKLQSQNYRCFLTASNFRAKSPKSPTTKSNLCSTLLLRCLPVPHTVFFLAAPSNEFNLFSHRCVPGDLCLESINNLDCPVVCMLMKWKHTMWHFLPVRETELLSYIQPYACHPKADGIPYFL